MQENRLLKSLRNPIGLGLAALGRPGYINIGHADDLNHDYDVATMEAHAHAVLDTAWEAGVRYFDAARSYGRAEAFLSSWLARRQISADAVVVGSKWGYTYTADWRVNVDEGEKHEIKEHSLPLLQQQIGESRALLHDHLDLYQIHSATLDSGVLTNHAVLKALAQLREGGLAIGLSVSGAQQAVTIWQALEVEIDGQPLSSIQATWNLLEQSATDALQAAHDAGWAVIIKEALANGRLTPRNNSASFYSLLNKIAIGQDSTSDAIALAAVVNQPFVDIALSGAATVEHLRANVGALSVDWDPSLLEQLTRIRESAETYWQTRRQLAWN